MRRAILFLGLLAGGELFPSQALPCVSRIPLAAQQVVDRIAARIEDDILTLSEMRELGLYQQLVEGHAASDDRLLTQLIEQWIVSREATATHYPRPAEADVSRELERLEKQFGSPEAFGDRVRQLGLSVAAVRRLVERQMYLARYLGYKFRPAVQVDATAVRNYYRDEFVPLLAGRGQAAPPLETVRAQIRELLVQRGISQLSARWLEEARSRLKVELEREGSGP